MEPKLVFTNFWLTALFRLLAGHLWVPVPPKNMVEGCLGDLINLDRLSIFPQNATQFSPLCKMLAGLA